MGLNTWLSNLWPARHVARRDRRDGTRRALIVTTNAMLAARLHAALAGPEVAIADVPTPVAALRLMRHVIPDVLVFDMVGVDVDAGTAFVDALSRAHVACVVFGGTSETRRRSLALGAGLAPESPAAADALVRLVSEALRPHRQEA
jgi:hypothetical protein